MSPSGPLLLAHHGPAGLVVAGRPPARRRRACAPRTPPPRRPRPRAARRLALGAQAPVGRRPAHLAEASRRGGEVLDRGSERAVGGEHPDPHEPAPPRTRRRTGSRARRPANSSSCSSSPAAPESRRAATRRPRAPRAPRSGRPPTARRIQRRRSSVPPPSRRRVSVQPPPPATRSTARTHGNSSVRNAGIGSRARPISSERNQRVVGGRAGGEERGERDRTRARAAPAHPSRLSRYRSTSNGSRSSGFSPTPDEGERHAERARDRHDHPALGGRVVLGQHHGVDAHGRVEDLGLREGVLPRRGVEHEQAPRGVARAPSRARSCRSSPAPSRAPRGCAAVPAVSAITQLRAPGPGARDAVEDDRPGVGARLLRHDGQPEPLAEEAQLVDGRGPERVARHEHRGLDALARAGTTGPSWRWWWSCPRRSPRARAAPSACPGGARGAAPRSCPAGARAAARRPARGRPPGRP